MRREWGLVLGPLLIVLGAMWPGWIKVRLPALPVRASRAVPVMLGASAVGWLENLKPLGRYRHAFEVAGGLLLILAGLYMLNAYFIIVPELAT